MHVIIERIIIMADRKYPEAFYPGRDYDQGGWMWEKSQRIINSLCCIIDSNCINNDDLKSDIYNAIKNASLLYTFWCGKRDLHHECFVSVINNGSEGFKRFKYINGLDGTIDEESKYDEDKVTEKTIMSLIGPEKTNRTLIHEKIRHIYYKSDFIKNLEDNLYKVTMGEKSWDWFVDKYKDREA